MANFSLILNAEQLDAINSVAHEFIGKSGLTREQYRLHFITDIDNLIEIKAGNVIHIAINCHPLKINEWRSLALRIGRLNLREMLFTEGKAIKTFPMKYSYQASTIDNDTAKKVRTFKEKYEITSYSVVRVKDKVSGKEFEVQHTGGAFVATELAINYLKEM